MIHDVSLRDLDFRKVPFQWFSSGGTPYLRWAAVGMPKINEAFVRSAFYLYRSRKDALRGVNAGGTGFVVSKRVGEDRSAYYAVTNKHVLRGDANEDGFPVVRLNTTDGGVEAFEFDPGEWEYHPNAPVDVAAIELPIDRAKHEVSAISDEYFVGEDHGWKVGDDVFMIGLFVDHEGREVNRPLARFGNISMVASKDAKVRDQEAFIIDMHSRSGFSGSPVFAYRTFGADLTGAAHQIAIDARPVDRMLQDQLNRYKRGERNFPAPREVWTMARTQPALKLLGVHCGQFKERWEIEQRDAHGQTVKSPVDGMSGMTYVAPAWKISEVLSLPKFVEQRERMAEQPDQAGPSVMLERVESKERDGQESDVNPSHKESFNSLLDAAVRGKP